MSNEDLLAAAKPPRRQEMVRLAIAGFSRQNTWAGKQCPLLVAACATLHSWQPELALNDLTRSINIAPSAKLTLRGRQFIANVIMSRRR